MNYDAGFLRAQRDYENKLPPEPEPVEECCVCGCEIYEGEEYFDVNDEIVCADCDRDYMKQFKKVGA